VVITFIDNETKQLHLNGILIVGYEYTVCFHETYPELKASWDRWSAFYFGGTETGIFLRSGGSGCEPLTSFGLYLEDYSGSYLGNCTYRTDEYGGAYVVAVIYS